MAIIKNISTPTQKPIIGNKIGLKEKWNDYKKRIAKKLNRRTKYWQSRQKKQFLIVFCSGFITLLLLSLLEVPKMPSLGKTHSTPALLLPNLNKTFQIPQRFSPNNRPPQLPLPIDSSSKNKRPS